MGNLNLELWSRWRGPSTRRHRPDYGLLVYLATITALGLIVQYVVSPALSRQTSGVSENYYFFEHLISVLVGLVAFFVAYKLPIKNWVGLTPLIFVGGLVGILLALASAGAGSRWIQVGGLSFQPVEVIKLAFVLGLPLLVASLAKDTWSDGFAWRPLKPLIWLIGLVTFLVVIMQRDLGSMLVIMAITGGILFIGGVSSRLIAVSLAVALLAVSFFIASTPYRRDRFNTFLNPAADCLNEGYQTCQALVGVGSGQLFGRGVGRSVQVYGYLPEAGNDSIFAIYAEIFGFVGSVALVVLYYKLLAKMYLIAKKSEEILRLIVVGVMFWLAVQSVMNIGAMIGLLPLKGITLPLISAGGSSIVFVLFGLGLILQISSYTMYSNENTSSNNRLDGRRIRRTRHTSSGGR